jgi:hypothetical protein
MEDVGTMITVPIKDGDIWAGLEALLCTGGSIVDIVRVEHMTMKGHYFVVGKNTACEMSDDMYLAHLYVKTTEGSLHKIKFNQWASLIKTKIINTDRQIVFELLSSTFSVGYFSKLCVTCGSYFSGNKKQQDCETCAEHNRHAKVNIKDLPQKAKRKRIIIRNDTI